MKKYMQLICIVLMFICLIGLREKEKEILIYIDPGHGGIDGGCVGVDGTYEKDINLNISLELRNALINLGYVVGMTRIGDYDLAQEGSLNRKREDIIKRCEIMNQGNIFISIHCNAFPDSSVSGAQVFFSDDEEKQLAESIQESIKKMFNNTNRVPNRLTNKYILENVNGIGCIVEVGFLSNIKDLKMLKNLDYQRNISYAIAIGIDEFINNTFKKN